MSIIGSLARPLWLTLLDNNAAAVASGEVAQHIFPEQFFQGFVWIGGAGATLGLAILLAFRAKSKYGKMLGKTTVIPAIFNINEPIMFGAPIVLNPVLIIPFILAPVVNIVIAWAATVSGLVPAMHIAAPWTLPAPLFAFMATGGSWTAALLGVVLIIVSALIYYPFFKIYDKKLLAEEQSENQDEDQEERQAA